MDQTAEETSTWTLELEADEFYLVAALLQTPRPFFFSQSAFEGLPDEVVQDRLAKARLSLTARGLVEVLPDGAVQIDEVMAAFFDRIQASYATLAFTSHTPARQWYLHLSEDMLLEQANLPENKVALTVFRSLPDLLGRIEEALAFPQSAPPARFAFQLSGGSLEELFALLPASGDQACTDHLLKAGLSAADSAELAEALHGAASIGSLQVLTYEDFLPEPAAAALWLLSAPGGWWSYAPLLPDQADPIYSFQPASLDEVRAALHHLVQSLLHLPESTV